MDGMGMGITLSLSGEEQHLAAAGRGESFMRSAAGTKQLRRALIIAWECSLAGSRGAGKQGSRK